MAIDMEQFHQVYFEESFEGLDVMESGLLNLDEGGVDSETINTIFRAAHSIKGGGGTFGFMHITEFTHVLETLLDEMRDGKRDITRGAVDLLLQSVDCLREMMTATQNGTEIDQQKTTAVHDALEAMLQEGNGDNGKATNQEPAAGDATAPGSGWTIDFKPHSHLLQTGNDPLRMFRELAALGELDVQASHAELPSFDAFDPEASYLEWHLTLHGAIAKEQVAEVFDWVDGDCDLTITGLPSEPASADSAPETPLESVPAVDNRRQGDRRQGDGDRRTSDRRAGGRAGGADTSIRVGIDKIDGLINLIGELVITQAMLGQFGDEDFDMSQVEALRDGLDQLARNTHELQETVMAIRMLPISFAFNRFPRLVRDLSAKLGKQIQLKIGGEQTELDKTVLEKISDPLVHLVRNSLDHGIEMPDVRRAAGKPEIGTIRLDAFHASGNIVIEVTDDGAGLPLDKILAKARSRGLVGADEVPSSEQIHELIFQAGFSTATEVSDVSGRGVGMDVVKRNIKDLGGHVELRSEPGKGSTFTIRLPLTLAILDGQLIRVGAQTFIVSLVSIVESLQVDKSQLNTVAGRGELYNIRDQYIPVIRLYDAFGIEPRSTTLERGLLMVVESDGRQVGLFVDELLGQQQVMIKSLETNFQQVQGLAGATILGDGAVALIIDVPGLVQKCLASSDSQSAGAARPATAKVA